MSPDRPRYLVKVEIIDLTRDDVQLSGARVPELYASSPYNGPLDHFMVSQLVSNLVRTMFPN